MSRQNERMMTSLAIRQLTKERDDMLRQIAKREKEIAHFSERLTHSLMPNQIGVLKAQRAHQIAMIDADQDVLANLERLLAAEIASQS
jgi:hypothetical protein